MKIATKKLSELKPAQYNPRQISDTAMAGLRASIERFGLVEPIVWNKQTGHIVGGHQRLKVLEEQGVKKTEVVVIDIAESEERALNVTLNNPGITGEFTPDLQAILGDIKLDIGEDDFCDLRLDDLLDPVLKEGKTDPDDIPEVTEPTVKPGQIWKLGMHRVMCGDSTDAGAVALLMDGMKADMVFTDPPYGIDYIPNYSTSNRPYKNSAIKGDDKVDISWIELFEAPRRYVCTRWDVYPHWLTALSNVKNLIVWDKGQGAAGNVKSYAPRHEFIIFTASDSGETHRDKRQDNLWLVPGFAQFTARTKEDTWGVHPTQKPVQLVENAILDSSHAGEVVVDPFLGSGSTLIACERTDRACYGMEIDPHYCDVIIKRWEDYTGYKAALVVQ